MQKPVDLGPGLSGDRDLLGEALRRSIREESVGEAGRPTDGCVGVPADPDGDGVVGDRADRNPGNGTKPNKIKRPKKLLGS